MGKLSASMMKMTEAASPTLVMIRQYRTWNFSAIMPKSSLDGMEVKATQPMEKAAWAGDTPLSVKLDMAWSQTPMTGNEVKTMDTRISQKALVRMA